MKLESYAKAPFWKEYPDRDTEYVRFYPVKHNKIQKEDLFTKKNMGFYVHIPFCKNVCMSCPYHKTKPTAKNLNNYLEALKKEISNYASRPYVKNHIFTSGYIGGGTPTTLSKEKLEDLLQHIHNSYHISDNAEITIETTPVDLTAEKLEVLRKYGVDRISLGVQSFNDDELINIGRNYNQNTIVEIIQKIHSYGYKKLNIDLMYGLPGQTMESWIDTIEKSIEMDVSGVSLYNFMLLEKTNNVIKRMRNQIPEMPDDNMRTKQFYKAAEMLSDKGYLGLFGDEFSKPGFKNAYVTKPWEECLDYVATGAWAMGNVKNHWYFNETDINKYMDIVNRGELPLQIGAEIKPKDRLRRKMILGVKTGAVNREDYYKCFGIDMEKLFGETIDRLENIGLVKLTKEELSVTGPLGWYYLDNISKSFYSDQYKRYPQPVQNETVRYF